MNITHIVQTQLDILICMIISISCVTVISNVRNDKLRCIKQVKRYVIKTVEALKLLHPRKFSRPTYRIATNVKATLKNSYLCF